MPRDISLRVTSGDMMDSDDPTADEPEKPKSKLAPLTEWHITPTPAPPPPPSLEASPSRTPWLLGAGLALIVAITSGVLYLGRPGAGDNVTGTAIPEARVPMQRKAPAPAALPPITLPSGLIVERKSVLNYDLAAWLQTTPVHPRTFMFDRIRFAPGSAAVPDAAQPALQELSQIMTAYPTMRVTITGNGPGSLGIERATAIRDALLRLAADPAQFATRAGNRSENPPSITVQLDLGVRTDLDA